MPYYNNEKVFKHREHALFGRTFKTGEKTPHSGIYRCINCGFEDVSEEDEPFPPQDHHHHKPGVGPIIWQLVAATITP